MEKYYKFPLKDEQEYEKEKKLNHLGYFELLWCMKTDEDILLVSSCKSIDSPKGCLTEAWNQLNKKIWTKGHTLQDWNDSEV